MPISCETEQGEWIDCPIYFGIDLEKWIVAIEKFFLQFEIPTVQYTNLASHHIGVPSTSVIQYEESIGGWSWYKFVGALREEFASPKFWVEQGELGDAVIEELHPREQEQLFNDIKGELDLKDIVKCQDYSNVELQSHSIFSVGPQPLVLVSLDKFAEAVVKQPQLQFSQYPNYKIDTGKGCHYEFSIKNASETTYTFDPGDGCRYEYGIQNIEGFSLSSIVVMVVMCFARGILCQEQQGCSFLPVTHFLSQCFEWSYKYRFNWNLGVISALQSAEAPDIIEASFVLENACYWQYLMTLFFSKSPTINLKCAGSVVEIVLWHIYSEVCCHLLSSENAGLYSGMTLVSDGMVWDPGLITSERQRVTKELFYLFELWAQLYSGRCLHQTARTVVSKLVSLELIMVILFQSQDDHSARIIFSKGWTEKRHSSQMQNPTYCLGSTDRIIYSSKGGSAAALQQQQKTQGTVGCSKSSPHILVATLGVTEKRFIITNESYGNYVWLIGGLASSSVSIWKIAWGVFSNTMQPPTQFLFVSRQYSAEGKTIISIIADCQTPHYLLHHLTARIIPSSQTSKFTGFELIWYDVDINYCAINSRPFLASLQGWLLARYVCAALVLTSTLFDMGISVVYVNELLSFATKNVNVPTGSKLLRRIDAPDIRVASQTRAFRYVFEQPFGVRLEEYSVVQKCMDFLIKQTPQSSLSKFSDSTTVSVGYMGAFLWVIAWIFKFLLHDSLPKFVATIIRPHFASYSPEFLWLIAWQKGFFFYTTLFQRISDYKDLQGLSAYSVLASSNLDGYIGYRHVAVISPAARNSQELVHT